MKKVAVFGDLTALYDVKSDLKKNINYDLLDKSIKEYFKISEFAHTKFYTLFHPENPSQVDFVNMLRTKNWDVETKRPSEVRRTPNSNGSPHRNYRFDAQIAYNIGESTGDEYDTIVVISDSIELLKPLAAAAKYEDIDVNVAFFSDAMDRRWWSGMKDSKIKFIDLGEIMHKTRTFKPEVQESERFE